MRRLGVAVLTACGAALLFSHAASAAPSVRAVVRAPNTSVGLPFAYIVEAKLDSDEESEGARIVASTGAFEAVGSAVVERDGRTVRLTQQLACLGLACVPGRTGRVVVLPAARVVVGGRTTTAKAVSLTVVPRVPAAVVAASTPAYVRQTGIPAAALRGSPDLLGLVAAGGSLAALLLGVGLIVAELQRRRRSSRTITDEYERAVRLLREATERSAPDRRRAASLLSRVARGRVGTGLAGAAGRLAWSRNEPDAPAARQLADRAESEAR